MLDEVDDDVEETIGLADVNVQNFGIILSNGGGHHSSLTVLPYVVVSRIPLSYSFYYPDDENMSLLSPLELGHKVIASTRTDLIQSLAISTSATTRILS